MHPQLENIKTRTSQRFFTIGEEIAHSITHGIGAGMSIVGLVILVVLAAKYGDAYQIVSFSIYGATLIILYLASTLYHGFQHPRIKQVLQVIDHAAIFLLIAGTYTPFLLVGVRGTWGWTLLIIVWGLALLGVGFRAIFVNRYEKVAVLAYVLMGWLCVVAFKEMTANIPLGGIIWIATGGAVYTIGVIFYALRKIPYMHTIWHLFVLGGSICHYLGVLFYLAPSQ
ncbi:MAG: hemolysin III family protein [Anaerolineae bacterium]|nr:hemolysin III family protein [Anaerolineae bacterium]MBL6966098.1 hemolysin III family protein [Anaerolineales bacterium]